MASELTLTSCNSAPAAPLPGQKEVLSHHLNYLEVWNLLDAGGRVVHVSSGLGKLSGLPKAYQSLVQKAESTAELAAMPFLPNEHGTLLSTPPMSLRTWTIEFVKMSLPLTLNTQMLSERLAKDIKLYLCKGWSTRQLESSNPLGAGSAYITEFAVHVCFCTASQECFQVLL